MPNSRRFVFACAVFACAAPLFAAPAHSTVPNARDLPAALKESKSLGLPVLVILSKPKAAVPAFVDARVVELARGFACGTAALTPALAKQYDASGDFALLVLEPDGTVAARLGSDATPDATCAAMAPVLTKARAGFRAALTPDADTDAKGKRAALAGLVRLGAGASDLIPLLAAPGELKDAARKALAALPSDATVPALLEGLRSADPAVRAACHPLATQSTGYTKAPLKVWQTGTDAERAAAWDKWNEHAQTALFPLNRAVLAFCEKNMGEQVNNGECAMLVIDAYAACKAKPMVHSGATYVWGRALRDGEPVIPGDVLQYEGTKFGNGWSFPHHTSVVRKVLEAGRYEILEQNVGGTKKVVANTIDLNTLKQGTVVVYRPQR